MTRYGHHWHLLDASLGMISDMHKENNINGAKAVPSNILGRGGWVAVGFNFVLCTAIAVVFTAAGGRFFENMVFSHSIGWTIYSFCQLTLRLFWHNKPMSAVGTAVILIIGVAGGFIVGQAIAARILGLRASYADLFSMVNWPTLVTAIVGTVIAITYFALREKRLLKEVANAQLSEKSQTTQRELADAQLHLVRAQVEPHMLFNTLANLRALIMEDQAQAVKMLDRLNGFLRASLNRNRQTTLSLSEEFELLSNYLELMKVRLADRMSYSLDLPVALRGIEIPTWLLQPLVENAITHGLEPSLTGGRITVSASQLGQTLVLNVSNTGEPLSSNFDLDQLQPRSDGGFGLYQCRERVKQLYEGRGSMKVLSSAQETQIVITLPLN